MKLLLTVLSTSLKDASYDLERIGHSPGQFLLFLRLPFELLKTFKRHHLFMNETMYTKSLHGHYSTLQICVRVLFGD